MFSKVGYITLLFFDIFYIYNFLFFAIYSFLTLNTLKLVPIYSVIVSRFKEHESGAKRHSISLKLSVSRKSFYFY